MLICKNDKCDYYVRKFRLLTKGNVPAIDNLRLRLIVPYLCKRLLTDTRQLFQRFYIGIIGAENKSNTSVWPRFI